MSQTRKWISGPAPVRASKSVVVLIAAAVLAACGGDGTTEPPTPPTITIEGVEDGGEYAPPVTINIDVDRGSFQATLNGAPFLSGMTVMQRGEHVLRVTARDGTVTSEEEVRFTIAGTGSSTLVIRMLDLGENGAGGGGDAILITDSAAGGSRHVLIDAGPGPGGNDLGYVARTVAGFGVDTLAALILSHAHSDHLDGMSAVLSAIHVRRFIYNGQQRTYSAYNAMLSNARARADTVIVLSSMLELALSEAGDGADLTLIPPITTYLANSGASGHELNEGSIGGLLEKEGFRLFLTGDGEVEATQRWRTEFSSLSADLDVLKVGHHGANNAIFDNGFSGTSTWLTHTKPSVSIISANGRTHPRVNAVQRLLAQNNNRTYCTNVHGTIEIRAWAARDFEVRVERNADADCAPGSEATT